MTFNANLEKILTIPDNEIDLHMVTFTRICSPCQIRYEFIGLMCSFEQDMTEILKSVGADKLVSLPQRNQTG